MYSASLLKSYIKDMDFKTRTIDILDRLLPLEGVNYLRFLESPSLGKQVLFVGERHQPDTGTCTPLKKALDLLL